jgi:dephospho-CoA kinase
MSDGDNNSALLIGLTGGIGSGKSTVAAYIERRYPVLYSDRIARQCMQDDEQVRNELQQAFGVQVYLSDGSLDRNWLAEVVFADHRKLERLNAIVHPPTHRRILEEAKRLFADGAVMVFVESALLFEAELQNDFDYIVSVLADPEAAVERLMTRDSGSADAVRARMRHQLPPEEKAALADFTIRNNGTIDEALKATDIVLAMLSTLQPRRT